MSFTNAIPGGALVPVAVEYYDSTGSIVTSVTVAANSEVKIFAVVKTPNGTPVGDYKVTQSATGVYSTIVKQDDPAKDIVRVTADGKVGVAKFVKKIVTPTPIAAGTDNVTNNTVVINNPENYTATDATTADPKTDIVYRIIAKNNYNSAVSGFFISDTVPTNTTFKSVGLEGITAAKTIYRVGITGAWTNLDTTPIPTAAKVAGTVIQVARDDNNDLTPDALPSISASPAGSNELSANFVVTVK